MRDPLSDDITSVVDPLLGRGSGYLRINNQTIAPMNAKVERFSIVSTVSPISIGHLLTQAPYQTDTKQYANKHERESTDCNQLFYGID